MMSLLESALRLPLQAMRVGMDLVGLGWKALAGGAACEKGGLARAATQPADAVGGAEHSATQLCDHPAGRKFQEAEPLWNGCLKLVEYQILFVKRGFETAFPQRQELVWDCLTNEQYRIWKIAEFVQHLTRAELPDKWKRKGYPTRVPDEGPIRLPEDDGKYLRVWFQVVNCYPREPFCFEEKQVEALWQINRSLQGLGAAVSAEPALLKPAPVSAKPPALPEARVPEKRAKKRAPQKKVAKKPARSGRKKRPSSAKRGA